MYFLEDFMYISCKPTDAEITKALAQAFSIQAEQILITTTINWPGFDPDLHIIVCYVLEMDLENFPIQLDLTLAGDLPGPLKNDFERFGIISESLQCQLLTTPDTPIEKDSVLFNGIGDFREVNVREDDDKLVLY